MANERNISSEGYASFLRGTPDAKEGHRHFTEEGYEELNELLRRIHRGDKSAQDDFALMVQPWQDRVIKDLASKRLEAQRRGEEPQLRKVREFYKDAAPETLLQLLQNARTSELAWHDFSTRYRTDLSQRARTAMESAISEDQQLLRGKALSKLSQEGPERHAVEGEQLKDAVARTLKKLTPMERQVLAMRHALPPEEREYSLDEAGRKYNVTAGRIMRIEAKALRKLRHPARAESLRPFLEGYPNDLQLEDYRVRLIMERMEPEFMVARQAVADAIGDRRPSVNGLIVDEILNKGPINVQLLAPLMKDSEVDVLARDLFKQEEAPAERAFRKAAERLQNVIASYYWKLGVQDNGIER